MRWCVSQQKLSLSFLIKAFWANTMEMICAMCVCMYVGGAFCLTIIYKLCEWIGLDWIELEWKSSWSPFIMKKKIKKRESQSIAVSGISSQRIFQKQTWIRHRIFNFVTEYEFEDASCVKLNFFYVSHRMLLSL